MPGLQTTLIQLHRLEVEKDIIIDGQSIHYDETGDGQPVVLMHGWGCSHSTVNSIAAVASRTNRVYNIDLPGFGGSPEPEDVWGVEQYTALIEKFIDRLGISRPILAGHSFGGRISILYSSRNPNVDSVVLVDAAGIKPRRSLRYYYKVYSFKAAKMAMKLMLGKEKAEKRIEKMRASRGSSDYSQSSPRMRAILSKCVNEDLTANLKQIKVPVLLVWGENDTATPMSDARKMERLIPDAGLVSFPGCGHYSFLDNPGQFAAVLNSFLVSRNNQPSHGLQ